jgi:hypothetical protein
LKAALLQIFYANLPITKNGRKSGSKNMERLFLKKWAGDDQWEWEGWKS